MSNSWSFAWLIEKKTTSIVSIIELAFRRLAVKDRSLEPVIRNWVCTARKGRMRCVIPVVTRSRGRMSK